MTPSKVIATTSRRRAARQCENADRNSYELLFSRLSTPLVSPLEAVRKEIREKSPGGPERVNNNTLPIFRDTLLSPRSFVLTRSLRCRP